MLKEEELTGKIIGVAMRVHSELGPGFKENIYHKAMIVAMKHAGIKVSTEVQFPVKLGIDKVGMFRVDLLIEEKVIVEIKAVCGIMPKIFRAQVISYLKASGKEVGLILNFGNPSLEYKRYAH